MRQGRKQTRQYNKYPPTKPVAALTKPSSVRSNSYAKPALTACVNWVLMCVQWLFKSVVALTKPSSVHSYPDAKPIIVGVNRVLMFIIVCLLCFNVPAIVVALTKASSIHWNSDAEPALIRSLCVQLRSNDFPMSMQQHAWLIVLWNWCEICSGHSLSRPCVLLLVAESEPHRSSFLQCWHIRPLWGRWLYALENYWLFHLWCCWW